ncbi:MAG: Smr/MutS family protein [Gemmatimonadota bacterium]
MPTVLVLNIKASMPTVDEARRRLIQEIQSAKAKGYKAIKLIHGYGSTGQGGALRVALRKSLNLRFKEGVIRSFVAGERWDPFEPVTRGILDSCPELRRDQDLGQGNEGVTIVLL